MILGTVQGNDQRSLYGIVGDSFAFSCVLATVVGVLVEVPVMLSVVWIVNRTKPWYEESGTG